MRMPKKRLDVLLVERQLIETREKAKRVIMAGLVFTGQERLDKPGVKVSEDIPLTIKGKDMPYVGRGGLKLEKALQQFDIDVRDQIMIDVGSSTGGFTDCALQNGLALSYAVDVGYNQLAWKLRNDERVVVMERTNFRYATPDLFTKGKPTFASIDVSFISLRLMLPPLQSILQNNSDVVALIKPQFEAGKEQVGKKGIVRNKSVHVEVVQNIIDFAVSLNYSPMDLTYSPITGGDGNIEFLVHLKYAADLTNHIDKADIQQVIDEAHSVLQRHHK
ncbi:MAG TPA: TlyA family RNA methyltransferase [Candidatus Avamphibacillus intestinigallinarum]|nr:TlyA family RNA methyltransferase [Candidatus Avamphibacillus intestinigallinarum]